MFLRNKQKTLGRCRKITLLFGYVRKGIGLWVLLCIYRNTCNYNTKSVHPHTLMYDHNCHCFSNCVKIVISYFNYFLFYYKEDLLLFCTIIMIQLRKSVSGLCYVWHLLQKLISLLPMGNWKIAFLQNYCQNIRIRNYTLAHLLLLFIVAS